MAGSFVWPFLGVLFVYFCLRKKSHPALQRIPYVKYNAFMPDIFNRLIYYPKAKSMIYRGYEKYKDSPFRMLTGDGEIVVLPAKYLAELKHLPPSILSSLDAQFENALGHYTNILISSYLPSQTCESSPGSSMSCDMHSIPGCQTVKVRKNAMHTHQQLMIPIEDKWTAIEPQKLFVHLISRATSRVMAGESLCRNEEWLNAAGRYSVNVGLCLILLRPFPNFLRPFVAPFLPPVQQMKKQVRFTKDLFVPIINKRRKAEAAKDPGYIKPDDFLQWMMDGTEEEQDQDPEALAHHMLLLVSLAVVHTSTMAMCHILYDLIHHPEYLEPLREEITKTLPDGWANATKASFEAQRRMDSFLRESQRFGPPGELSFHRIDGLILPEGTHICFPSGPMSKDPSFIGNPEPFDGFRWSRDASDRNSLDHSTTPDPGEMEPPGSKKQYNAALVPSTSTSFVSISPSNMHFGFGRQACPGRFFAASTIKAIMSHLIMEYDFKFDDCQTGRRPVNWMVGEHVLPNTDPVVLIRKRSIGL
ncbi:uncharacterized protein N7477_007654 [Penicillium maclennaniae]|uniref:uncharacterized protein n=1 Tax=Penicillium maclennaniae TaxID=1343394 RepID=UPI00254015CE|nr:uncharacterized protein N7477_007654 [Penicillium maclennaniae]KAJ5665206.1 hypothetical protein N7477_007654 [Penicillium maclennaniae]